MFYTRGKDGGDIQWVVTRTSCVPTQYTTQNYVFRRAVFTFAWKIYSSNWEIAISPMLLSYRLHVDVLRQLLCAVAFRTVGTHTACVCSFKADMSISISRSGAQYWQSDAVICWMFGVAWMDNVTDEWRWHRKFMFGVMVRLLPKILGFVYQGHRVKVKITQAEKESHCTTILILTQEFI